MKRLWIFFSIQFDKLYAVFEATNGFFNQYTAENEMPDIASVLSKGKELMCETVKQEAAPNLSKGEPKTETCKSEPIEKVSLKHREIDENEQFEIVQAVRHAKKKKDQIVIESELHMIPVSQVVEVLKAAGEFVEEKSPAETKNYRIIALRKQGLSIRTIADKLGLSFSTVQRACVSLTIEKEVANV